MAIARFERIYLKDNGELGLLWVLRNPAGAVHLQVDIDVDGRQRVFAGRHAYAQVHDHDGHRVGECDLLPGVESCWFNAFDSYGATIWREAQTFKGDEKARREVIYAHLLDLHGDEFRA